MKLFIFIMFFLIGCASIENKKDIAITDEPQKPFSGFGDSIFNHGAERLPKDIEVDSTKDLDMLFKIANSLYDSGNYSESRKLYLDILRIDPGYLNSAASHFNLGLIAIKQNDYNESAERFKIASQIFSKTEDVRDSWMLLMESLRNTGSWDEIISESDAFLRDPGLSGKLEAEFEVEAGLRKAEAQVMKGDDIEGRQLTDYLLFNIRKGGDRSNLLYNPNYAYGNFIMGVSESQKFFNIKLEETEESLLEKCKIILEAQAYYLKAIQTGVIYWTNASAFEIAKLYTTLYQEMISIPVPDDLNEEEIKVYECELWKKISGLLTRPRRYLKRSIEAAEKINEENQYTAKSFELLRKIEELYEKREMECSGY